MTQELLHNNEEMIQYKMTSSAQLKVYSSNNCMNDLIGYSYYIKGEGTGITSITGEGTSTLYVTMPMIINHVRANYTVSNTLVNTFSYESI